MVQEDTKKEIISGTLSTNISFNLWLKNNDMIQTVKNMIHNSSMF